LKPGTGRRPGDSRRRALIEAFLLSSAIGASTAAPATEPGRLNLFQLTSRAHLVVHVRVRDGGLKYAMVDVLDVLKGESPSGALRVAFRDFNFSRPPGVGPIVFPNGQEEILFLVPCSQVPRSEKKREKNRDLFDLFLGSEGRITVPAEGAGATFEAIRGLAAIAAMGPSSQIDAFRDLLDSENPALVESALEETLRLRAVAPPLYSRLNRLLRSPSPGIRSKALRALAQMFGARVNRGAAQDDEIQDQANIALAGVLEIGRNDPDEVVRVEAVRALAAWPARPDVAAELWNIARQDAAQSVRYEAERALFTGASR
jgi:hypothetical protein